MTKRSEWRPIVELTSNDWVLLWDRDAARVGFKRRSGGWCIEAKSEIDNEATPTHWMPLPDPPSPPKHSIKTATE